MSGQNETVERIAGRIASKQHGNVARWQLLAAGVSTDSVDKRLDKGVLIGVHRGVYRVGHVAPGREATYMAGVLACGKGARITGRAAAHLLGIIKGPPPPPEVTSPHRRVVENLTTRQERNVTKRDTTVWMGISVTTPARTLVDLAAILDEDDLARAVHEAAIRHHVRPVHVEAVLARRPNSRGAAALRAVLRGETKVTLSKLEKEFLDLLRRNKLPLPTTNRRAGAHLVDCRWPEHKLTVELDSYRYHASRHAFEQDRGREREAYARGDQFRRYTWGDVTESPESTLEELRTLIA